MMIIIFWGIISFCMIMWIKRGEELGTPKDMAFPARPVFTPFVVVVGGKYFLPVPGCLLFGREILLQQETIFYCA